MTFNIKDANSEVFTINNYGWKSVMKFLIFYKIINNKYRKNLGWYLNEGEIFPKEAFNIEQFEKAVWNLQKLLEAVKTREITIY